MVITKTLMATPFKDHTRPPHDLLERVHDAEMVITALVKTEEELVPDTEEFRLGTSANPFENMSELHENLARSAERRFQESVRRSEKNLEEQEGRLTELDNKSMQNFASWRDYLHKYYLLILAFISGTKVFVSLNEIDSLAISIGAYLALAGIIIGFFAINLYFYFERRWFQISSYVSMNGFGELGSHPDAINDPVLAHQLHISVLINGIKLQLQEAKRIANKKQIIELKKKLKGHKMEKGLMKYLGQQFGWIENFWIIFVSISLLLSSAGLVLIFSSSFGIIHDSQNTQQKTESLNACDFQIENLQKYGGSYQPENHYLIFEGVIRNTSDTQQNLEAMIVKTYTEQGIEISEGYAAMNDLIEPKKALRFKIHTGYKGNFLSESSVYPDLYPWFKTCK
jgi:hypothetical protein